MKLPPGDTGIRNAMHPKSCLAFPITGLCLLLSALSHGALTVLPSKPDGIYTKGETITWKVTLTDAPSGKITNVSYAIKQDGGQLVRQGSVDLKDGTSEITVASDTPGVLLVELNAGGGDQPKLNATGGAAVEPEKIPRSAPRPADFDAFWKSHLDELANTPANAVLTEGTKERPDVLHWNVAMDLPRGRKMLAQLARPEKEGKLPAMIIFQYAGVYQLPPANVLSKAAQGWLVLNVNPHELPLNESPEFYKEQAEGPLKDYVAIGNDDREKSYFLRMFLACSRAVDYLASRQDWDGRTLVVTGTSQGGLQSIVAAGLNPKVTAMVVNVPAGCDDTAPLAGRAMPWPYWLKEIPGKNRETLISTCGYFDGVNFASRIKCPAMVAYGLLDRTATASGVSVMMNELGGPVERVMMPESDHHGNGGKQAPFQQRSKVWFEALLKTGKPPVETY
ncbi:MAG: acetylxylan esterase [Luteolibacter sp.]